jgi:hypothetical protein
MVRVKRVVSLGGSWEVECEDVGGVERLRAVMFLKRSDGASFAL